MTQSNIKIHVGGGMLYHIASLFLILGIPFLGAAEAVKKCHPFSKIIITSDNAVCKKDKQSDGAFIFEYQKNVCVTFADQSKVTSDLLEVVYNSKAPSKISAASQDSATPKSNTALQNFKHIIFKNNVTIVNAQRKALADTATFYLKEQRCVLDGNVKIWQRKAAPRDIPVAIQSTKAELNLITEQISFAGSSEQPVSTTIVLEGHPALAPKKKKSKHIVSHEQNSPTTPRRGS